MNAQNFVSPGIGGRPPSKAEARLIFARNLQAALVDKGINQSELAREAARHMPDKKFGRDLISNYVRARILPSPTHLRAMSKVLGKSEDALLPSRGLKQPAGMVDTATQLGMKDSGDGNCWLTVNQAVPWEVALQISQILKGTANAGVSHDSRSRKAG